MLDGDRLHSVGPDHELRAGSLGPRGAEDALGLCRLPDCWQLTPEARLWPAGANQALAAVHFR